MGLKLCNPEGGTCSAFKARNCLAAPKVVVPPDKRKKSDGTTIVVAWSSTEQEFMTPSTSVASNPKKVSATWPTNIRVRGCRSENSELYRRPDNFDFQATFPKAATEPSQELDENNETPPEGRSTKIELAKSLQNIDTNEFVKHRYPYSTGQIKDLS